MLKPNSDPKLKETNVPGTQAVDGVRRGVIRQLASAAVGFVHEY